jgi:hypothetical protein
LAARRTLSALDERLGYLPIGYFPKLNGYLPFDLAGAPAS